MTAALSSYVYGPTPPAQALAAGYRRLVMNENFNQFVLQSGNIKYLGDSGLWHNGLGFAATAPLANIVWNGPGDLRLSEASVNTCVRNWPSGEIPGTKSFLKGYFEARFKLLGAIPAGASNWAAFWLFSRKHQLSAPDPEEWSEIDIFETFASPNYAAALHDHHLNSGTFSESPAQSPDPGTWAAPASFDLKSFHTFGAVWNTGSVDYYMDDVLIQSSTANAINNTDHCSLILSSNTGQVQFQWVRVWR